MNNMNERSFELPFRACTDGQKKVLPMKLELDSLMDTQPTKMVPVRTQQDREWEAEKIRQDFIKSKKLIVPPKISFPSPIPKKA